MAESALSGNLQGRVRISAFYAEITAGAAQGKDIFIYAVKFLQKFFAVLCVILLSLLHPLKIQAVFQLRGSLHQNAPVILFHSFRTLGQWCRSRGDRSRSCCRRGTCPPRTYPSLIHRFQGFDFCQPRMGKSQLHRVLRQCSLSNVIFSYLLCINESMHLPAAGCLSGC